MIYLDNTLNYIAIPQDCITYTASTVYFIANISNKYDSNQLNYNLDIYNRTDYRGIICILNASALTQNTEYTLNVYQTSASTATTLSEAIGDSIFNDKIKY